MPPGAPVSDCAVQMSCSYQTPVLVSVDGNLRSVAIGELVDTYLPPVTSVDQHDVVPVQGLECTGVSSIEQVAWAPVTHVSRHPANGDMLTVMTRRGRLLKMTASHSFLVRVGNRVVPRPGHDLVVGDCLPVVLEMPPNPSWALASAPVELCHDTGWRIVAMIVRGQTPGDTFDLLTRDWIAAHFGDERQRAALPVWLLQAPLGFLSGVIQALFDTHDEDTEEECWGFANPSASTDLVPILGLCLARFGISTGVAPGRIWVCASCVAKYQTSIGSRLRKDALTRAVSRAGLAHAHPVPGMEDVMSQVHALVGDTSDTASLLHWRQRAQQMGATAMLLAELDQAISANVWWDPIVQIDVHTSTEMVYDFTVAEHLQSFMLANGVFVHNTLNSSPSPACTHVLSQLTACLRVAFHLAGVAMEGRSQLSGIPRVAEVIDATRNIKTACMTIRLVPDVMSSEDVELYARSLEHCPLSRLVASYEMEACDVGCVSKSHPEDAFLVAAELLCDEPLTQICSRGVLRLVLNRRLLRRRGLVPSRVLSSILRQNPECLRGVASPATSVEWIIRLRAVGVEFDPDAARVYADVMSATTVGGRRQIELAELIQVPRLLVNIEGGLYVENEVAIETAGSALIEMAWEPEIDWLRCTSNDVLDVYSTLGIAAARSVIFHELRMLVAGDSCKVSDRHIMMVANTMTQHGIVMPMSRHGINRIAETGPLLRCSFEETSDVLTDAGVWNEKDHMRGISQSIMMGQTPFLGTGCSDIVKRSGADNNKGGFSSSEVTVTSRRLVKSRFKDRKSAVMTPELVKTEVSDMMDVLFTEQLTQCEPPYMDDTMGSPGLWSSIAPSETSHQDNVTDATRVRQELLGVMSRVPFDPPRSPIIVPR